MQRKVREELVRALRLFCGSDREVSTVAKVFELCVVVYREHILYERVTAASLLQHHQDAVACSVFFIYLSCTFSHFSCKAGGRRIEHSVA